MTNFYYLYRITNKINGKIYIGVHKTSNIEDNYFGSGKLLKRAIKKHGKENFTKEILEFFDTEIQMYAREKEIVNYEFVNSSETYNIVEGGNGSFSYINSLPNQGHKPGQQKQASILGGLAFKEKWHNDEEFRQKIYRNFSENHKTHKCYSKNYKWISNFDLKKSKTVQPDQVNIYLSTGWVLGRKYLKNTEYTQQYRKGMKYKKRN
jgi:hypothetical protein